MFTGIVQSIAKIADVTDKNGIRTFVIDFNEGFCTDLEIGASVAVDGVCLTVTELVSDIRVKFDVMLQSLLITMLKEQPKTVLKLVATLCLVTLILKYPSSILTRLKTTIVFVWDY
jgi:riboflavin synthase alpha subunit